MSSLPCSIDGCEDRRHALGLCVRHHWRATRYGDPLAELPRRPSLTERFWAKVEPGDSCWLWAAAKNVHGYGVFRVADGRNQLAHRFAYEQVVGPIADGMFLDHLCRNPACVNPSHLEQVTNQENMRRGILGVLTTHCPQGHPYDEANTAYYRPGRRTCRTCCRERTAARAAAQRLTAVASDAR